MHRALVPSCDTAAPQTHTTLLLPCRGKVHDIAAHATAACVSHFFHLSSLPLLHFPAANVSMFVYDTNDIVSNQLRGAQHTWESSEINEMLWALRQHQAVQQLAAQQGKAPGPAVPLMVDVGANIGW